MDEDPLAVLEADNVHYEACWPDLYHSVTCPDMVMASELHIIPSGKNVSGQLCPNFPSKVTGDLATRRSK